jgi:hypothetical protein
MNNKEVVFDLILLFSQLLLRELGDFEPKDIKYITN